jgi:hypothetical protein
MVQILVSKLGSVKFSFYGTRVVDLGYSEGFGCRKGRQRGQEEEGEGEGEEEGGEGNMYR